MRQALGRGLDALIPTGAPEDSLSSESPLRIRRLNISEIRPNPVQPRKSFDPEKLSELAQSIKENGLAQPIIVSFDSKTNAYELLAGERRLKAAQLAGLTQIEAVVRGPLHGRQRLSLALIENLQREDLNPIEEALGYMRLMKDHEMTQSQICEVLGKSKSAVSNTLRLLSLPEEVQRALQNGEISEGHARALLMIKNTVDLIALYHAVKAQQLSVRDVEDQAKRIQEGGKFSARRRGRAINRPKSADIQAMEISLQHTLGTRVEIRVGKNPYQGTLLVHFFNLSDFDKIVNKLKK